MQFRLVVLSSTAKCKFKTTTNYLGMFVNNEVLHTSRCCPYSFIHSCMSSKYKYIYTHIYIYD